MGSIDWNKIENFFLTSFWGILALGIIGSILGGMLKWSFTNFIKWLNISGPLYFKRALFHVGKKSLGYREFSKSLLSDSKNSELIYIKIYEATNYLQNAIVFFLSLTVTIMIMIMYGVERPYLLAAFFALVIYFAFHWVRSGVIVSMLMPDELEEKLKDYLKKVPQNYDDWLKE